MPDADSSGCSPEPSEAATNKPIWPALGNTRAKTIFCGADGDAATDAHATATMRLVRMTRILQRKTLRGQVWCVHVERQRQRSRERDLLGLQEPLDADGQGGLRHIQAQA